MPHLTIKDVCERYSCSKATIYRWINLDNFPRGLVIGGTVRWPMIEILEFEKQRIQASRTATTRVTSTTAEHD